MNVRAVDQINITNVHATGDTAPVPRYSFDIYIHWTDHDGTTHTHSDTYIWPNVLADVPNNVVRRFMEKMVIAKVRVELGIDEWEDYV